MYIHGVVRLYCTLLFLEDTRKIQKREIAREIAITFVFEQLKMKKKASSLERTFLHQNLFKNDVSAVSQRRKRKNIIKCLKFIYYNTAAQNLNREPDAD